MLFCIWRSHSSSIWSPCSDVQHSVQSASSCGIYQRIQQRTGHATLDSIHVAQTGTHMHTPCTLELFSLWIGGLPSTQNNQKTQNTSPWAELISPMDKYLSQSSSLSNAKANPAKIKKYGNSHLQFGFIKNYNRDQNI